MSKSNMIDKVTFEMLTSVIRDELDQVRQERDVEKSRNDTLLRMEEDLKTQVDVETKGYDHLHSVLFIRRRFEAVERSQWIQTGNTVIERCEEFSRRKRWEAIAADFLCDSDNLSSFSRLIQVQNPSQDLLCKLFVDAVMEIWKTLHDLLYNYRKIGNVEGDIFTTIFTCDLKKFVAQNVLSLSI